MKNKRCLFITWDGPQVNYLEALFLPIFEGLQTSGHQFFVLQFTWGSRRKVTFTEKACESASIPYRKINIWRGLGGLGPFLSAIIGAFHIRRAVRDWQIDTLMPRSIMPALATLFYSGRNKLKVIFDADGLPADERVDFANLSPNGLTYRFLRDIEAQMVRQADSVIVRTDNVISTLIARAGPGNDKSKFKVVKNGRDARPYLLDFSKSVECRKNECEFTVCYVGSLGPKYGFEKMAQVIFELKNSIPNLRWLIFTGDSTYISREIEKLSRVDTSWIEINFLSAKDLPGALIKCDMALAFPVSAYSMHAVTLTKLGDYLLAGLPVIGSGWIGDIDKLKMEGVFFDTESASNVEIFNWIKNNIIDNRDNIHRKCHDIGIRDYSLEKTIEQYRSVLEEL